MRSRSHNLAEALAAAPDQGGWRAGLIWQDYEDLAEHLLSLGVSPPTVCDNCCYGNHADCRRFGSPNPCACCSGQPLLDGGAA